MKPYLSIVIPSYNSEKTIGSLLKSIVYYKEVKIEIIVVDNGSLDKTISEIEKNNNKNIKILKIGENRGPAYARNFGAGKARGEVILFLDSDVVVKRGTLEEIVKGFKEEKYRVAMTGVWDKNQKGRGLFPKFKALRDWSYWVNEKRVGAYYYLFSTRIAGIRRDVFEKLGGFNEKFKSADIEDIEFTYRIAKKYRVDFNEKMVVFHEFEGFFPIAKKYFKRSYQWTTLFLERKKFDPVATTTNEALNSISAVGFILFLFLGIFSFYNLLISLLFLIIHLIGIRKFLKFVFDEEGLFFTIYSFVMGIFLYFYIFSGAVKAFWDNFFREEEEG